MGTATHFFLSVNSGDGCRSLLPQLTLDPALYDLMILKGGTGADRSDFLAALGSAMEQAGAAVEYLHCAGDPERLDGVVLPQVRCAAVDGVPPHAAEPPYPGAVGRIVDLGRFYDLTALKAAREELIAGTDRVRAAADRASHILKAGAQMEGELRRQAAQSAALARLDRRAEGILRRELHRRGGEPGRTAYRYLGGLTHQGYICRYDTVETLCRRRYELEDRCGLGAALLKRLAAAASQRGWDTIVCLAPEEPERILHLLIPGLGLAFVTADGDTDWPGRPYRRLRLDALIDPSARGRLRFSNRLCRLLRQEATAALAEEKAARDALEEAYRPCMDHGGAETLAAVETARLLCWWERRETETAGNAG